MRVRRSLTIKQMAAVAVVALVTICIFIVLQLFHFVQQRKDDYAKQLESIAYSVRQPLSEAILSVDVPQAKKILNNLLPIGILSRAEVILPNQIQVLHANFPTERPVPRWAKRIFSLPVEITLPLYALERVSANPQPLAHLVLRADSYRMYQFILSALSAMLSTYLLLALVLSVSIAWCINRLIIHPLRAMAKELENIGQQGVLHHQLTLPAHHQDDELGILVRNYNRNQQLLAEAYTDMSRISTRFPVTELPNRSLFMHLLEQEISGGMRNEKFHLLVIGVETLQEVSGVMGEEQHRQLLLTMAQRLEQCIDENSLLAQLSKTEFAVLARGISRPFPAMQLARQMMLQMTQPLLFGNIQLRPSASIGIADYQSQGETAESLMRNASTAMMAAHHQGRNQIFVFEPHLTEKTQKRLTHENDILQAIENRDFTLFLQPQWNMQDQRVIGAEALLRWRQPDGSYRSPSEFVPGAEEGGMMMPLGNWVLEESCRILADWKTQGITLSLAVNISGLQVQSDQFLPHLQSLINQYQIDPRKLLLEITETARIQDLDEALTLLRELQGLGLSIALDDFGMGYSSLHYLNHLKGLPINMIKLDKSFVKHLPEDDAMARIVSAISEVLKLRVMAEGVETDEQRQWLLKHGIQCGQGYLFSEPLAREVFESRYTLRP
ncbi:biofilm formation regulator HmsP [Yersinia mollaretii]|uniref:biofilm formation regulator HmsP n=1 Tax=Yersinia mollaretii TaxID=33060 RepID=UPI0005DC41E5|nr:biofilm formation regulator HmsP [Yersinia mollaretii]MDA5528795.1 biofilm formation regulator HmsP [Yersinia mollaretii]MDR7875322.1 biofilm formation regulator HmsP [Yersinia mollaretii]WQC75236.1 biofilm formation regulator HmsP [Yersinia mollaretii]CNF28751.1 biofilm formation regulator HmsP [Yersinia mollaretii]